MTAALMNVMSLPAPAPIAPPIESMVVAICSAFLRGRSLIEKRGRDVGHARLVRRILRSAGPDEKPEADRGLLVMRHRDHLQSVGQRA